ncbi:MAG: nuclear transport factor 2 family protein [Actinomycetota bacterium]|nr:nuclear transport factor 2 family protein [Actinomycetota bacterium]
MELKEQLSVQEVVEAYHRAWRAGGAEQRRLLELCLTEDAELVQPNGRSVGRDGVIQRIVGLGERWPGAHPEVTSGTDEHHGFVRYSWDLRSADSVVLSGVDVGELAADGRLRRVVQFFGPMPELETDALASHSAVTR